MTSPYIPPNYGVFLATPRTDAATTPDTLRQLAKTLELDNQRLKAKLDEVADALRDPSATIGAKEARAILKGRVHLSKPLSGKVIRLKS